MGLIKWIKRKWDDWYYHDLDDGELPEWEDELSDYSDSYFEDRDQRAVYVLEELGRMAESAEKMEQCQAEYEAVTSLLIDMEEIDNLSKDVKLEMMNYAEKIESIEKQRRILYKKTGLMPEAKVSAMEKLETEIPSGIKKMKEAEEYRKLVNQDLKKLDSERNACYFRKRELKTTLANSKGIAVITGIALAMCFALLIILKFMYDMDVNIGFLIAGGAGAITITVLYVRFIEANAELRKLSKMMNKLINLHNTVKIRYINNTNLLSYLYMKYNVDSSEELESDWKLYVEEVGAREKDEQLKYDLDYYYNKLTKVLKKNNIKDPDIWTRQYKALYDKREMVEVRHALIGRRQKLREQMEYNEGIAIKAQSHIKDLGQRFPQYSSEIAAIVNKFDGV